MKPPIVVNDNPVSSRSGDVFVYDTVERAERALESYDVDDEALTFFDAEGRLLRLEIVNDSIRLKEVEAKPAHQSLLRNLLVDFFLRVGFSEDWCEKASLSELVDRAQKNFSAE